MQAQDFYFGADLSYVKQMEDCGALYKEDGELKDPFLIFADNHINLARFRLWHTPAWQDALGFTLRYSDFQDVQLGIFRAKNAGMDVLLNFQLSTYYICQPTSLPVCQSTDPPVHPSTRPPVHLSTLQQFNSSTLLLFPPLYKAYESPTIQ